MRVFLIGRLIMNLCRYVRQILIFIAVIFLLSACAGHKQQIMQLDVKDYEELIKLVHLEKYDLSQIATRVEISINCYRASEALRIYKEEIISGYTATIKQPSSGLWLIEYVKEASFDANIIKEDSDKFVPILAKYPNCDGPYAGVSVGEK